MSLQSESKLPLPSFFLYCHPSRAPLPLTDADTVSLPLPAPVAAVGLPGLPRPGQIRRRRQHVRRRAGAVAVRGVSVTCVGAEARELDFVRCDCV